MQNTLLDINPEGKLLREIEDILDELHIITSIKQEQINVIKTFEKNIKHTLLPKVTAAEDLKTAKPSEDSLVEPSGATTTNPNELLAKEDLEAAKGTMASADELLTDMHGRIAELATLKESAERTATAVSTALIHEIISLYLQSAAARSSFSQTAAGRCCCSS